MYLQSYKIPQSDASRQRSNFHGKRKNFADHPADHLYGFIIRRIEAKTGGRSDRPHGEFCLRGRRKKSGTGSAKKRAENLHFPLKFRNFTLSNQ